MLSSPAYLGRLEHPTPWTLQVMISLRRMARTVCDVHAAAGDLVAGLAREEGIARVQPWTAAARQTPADTAEIAAAARTS